MSRVAKKPILLDGVKIVLSANEIEVNGPKGKLSFTLHPLVKIVQIENDSKQYLTVEPQNNEKLADALAGTTRAIVNNLIIGITKGFTVELELVGVGYRAQASGAKLALSLGFSHPVDMAIPEGISVETPTNTVIILKGSNKQALGQFAEKIRKFRPPEPYKGKGIKYKNEAITRKEAKKK